MQIFEKCWGKEFSNIMIEQVAYDIMSDILATLALGSSNYDQPFSEAATSAPKLAKPLAMAPLPLFLYPVSLIRIDHHFVLFILVFCFK
jgi:hypothetical protein